MVPGLSSNEVKLLRGVLFPTDTTGVSTRIGRRGALRIQADNFSEPIGYTKRDLDRTSDPTVREALENA